MQTKKTKLDYFIESYAAYGLQSEAKDVVASHVQYLKASKAYRKAFSKHYSSYTVETMKGAKFAPVKYAPFVVTTHANIMGVGCSLDTATDFKPVRTNKAYKAYAESKPVKPVYVLRAFVVSDFNEQCATLIKIRADKLKTLTSRKAKLLASYKGKLACTVASSLVLKINGLLNAFEKMCANLTFKPQRAFFDSLADVRESLLIYKYGKRAMWGGFTMPDSQLMLSMQSTPIVSWLMTDSVKSVEACFSTLAKFKKSSQNDDIVAFGALIGRLRTSLCGRLYDDLNGVLITSANQEPQPNWVDSVKITDLVQGEYVSVPIGSENVPVEMLNARDEVARELSETETRMAYALESDECRKGIFGCVRAMTKAFEEGYANSDDKTSFLISFFTLNRGLYLQAFLDRAISCAIKGKGTADKSHLADLNSLMATYSVVATPNNGESRIVGVLGASDLVHYVKFICPWLTYKANDGGWTESAKWEGLATAHRGNGFPVVGSDNVCLYPPITLVRYLTVKKSIQAQVRITNRARKRHNESLAK